MEITFLLTIFFLNLYLIFRYYRKYRGFGFWTNPWSITIIYWFLNYPAKAIYTYFEGYSYYTDYHSILLFYYFLYFLTVVFAFDYLIRTDHLTWNYQNPERHFSNISKVFVNTLFYIIVSYFVYKIALGSFYNFSELAAEKRNIFENILLNIGALQWVVIALMLHLALIKSKFYFIHFSVLFVLTVIDSLISTAKAPIFYLLIVYLFVFSMNNRRVRLSIVAVFSVIGLLIFYYSYIARYSGVAVQERVGVNVIEQTFEVIFQSDDTIHEKSLDSYATRIELLDNLVVLNNRYDVIRRGDYEYGSLIEILNVIPRTLLPEKTFYQFNEFVQSEIMGYGMKGTTMSIGRIGEAYYLLGYFGFIFAFFYAVLYEKSYKYLFIEAKGAISILIYLNLFFGYFTLDNYLFENLFTLLFSTAFLWLLYIFTRRANW